MRLTLLTSHNPLRITHFAYLYRALRIGRPLFTYRFPPVLGPYLLHTLQIFSVAQNANEIFKPLYSIDTPVHPQISLHGLTHYTNIIHHMRAYVCMYLAPLRFSSWAWNQAKAALAGRLYRPPRDMSISRRFCPWPPCEP